jgi:hypothetical protein
MNNVKESLKEVPLKNVTSAVMRPLIMKRSWTTRGKLKYVKNIMKILPMVPILILMMPVRSSNRLSSQRKNAFLLLIVSIH